MAKLILATLCDDVREEKTGKFSLMGVFDRFLVADFRAPLPTFWLFAQIGCASEGEHTLSVELRRVEGTSVARVEIKHQSNARSAVTGLCAANINLRLEQLTIPGPGVYEFALHSDGEHLGSLPVEVLQPAPQLLQ
ncbi:MAG: hypothetical protein EXR70_19655 [Deltaproteobacteria bacterium]|nr:hypothetical protein [Deltaproteobacteria bacterium]